MNPFGTRGLVRQVVAVLLAATVSATLAACAAPDPGIDVRELWLERHSWGGNSPAGAVFSTVVVEGTGEWTETTLDGERRGMLSARELEALAAAARTTRLLEADGDPTCESAFDGTDVRYSWQVDGVLHAVSSCDVLIPLDDPLVVALNRLADEIDGGRR